MTTTSLNPEPRIPSPLPPSPRDFLAYERLIIDGFSTRQAAEELKISQTRIRQIVRRVADWLAENLPAHDETRQAAQIRLAQHIASERLHRYTCECERAWQQTRETKYVNLLIRLLTAQSKLPAHPHTLLSLAAEDNVVLSLREGQEADQTIHPPAPQPTTAAESRVGPACEASAGPPTPTRSVSEGDAASISPPAVAAATAPSSFSIPNSSFPSPPPIRACSPPQTPVSIANPKHSLTDTLSHSTETSSASNQNANHTARQSFLSPAHPSGATGILPLLSDASDSDEPITELQITPQSIALTTKNHSTRRERRRLQRLLSKK
ncbi:MAG TPA: hypothetical protein VGI40_08145 [Pirellulaceae bacterium]